MGEADTKIVESSYEYQRGKQDERKRCLNLIQDIMLNDDFRSGVDACTQIKKAIEKGEHGKG